MPIVVVGIHMAFAALAKCRREVPCFLKHNLKGTSKNSPFPGVVDLESG